MTNWSTVTSWTFSSSVYFLKLESDVIPWKLSLAKYKLRSPLIFPKDLFTGFIFEILFISTFSFNNLKDSSNGSKAKTFLCVTSDNGIAVSPVNVVLGNRDKIDKKNAWNENGSGNFFQLV